MALVVLLRGINVGGHRAFRPKVLAQELRAFDVVNIGAAGTFVVRNPGSRAQLGAALRSRLPTTAQFVVCDGRDLLRLAAAVPFDSPPPEVGLIRFVSFLARKPREQPPLPLMIPAGCDWYVRVTTLRGRLAVGEYRRQMKTIGYLGQLDVRLGTLVTTRSANTVSAIVRALKAENDPNHAAHVSRPRHTSLQRPNER